MVFRKTEFGFSIQKIEVAISTNSGKTLSPVRTLAAPQMNYLFPSKGEN